MYCENVTFWRHREFFSGIGSGMDPCNTGVHGLGHRQWTHGRLCLEQEQIIRAVLFCNLHTALVLLNGACLSVV